MLAIKTGSESSQMLDATSIAHENIGTWSSRSPGARSVTTVVATHTDASKQRQHQRCQRDVGEVDGVGASAGGPAVRGVGHDEHDRAEQPGPEREGRARGKAIVEAPTCSGTR